MQFWFTFCYRFRDFITLCNGAIKKKKNLVVFLFTFLHHFVSISLALTFTFLASQLCFLLIHVLYPEMVVNKINILLEEIYNIDEIFH